MSRFNTSKSLVIILLLLSSSLFASKGFVCASNSVMLSAVVQKSPPSITISWFPDYKYDPEQVTIYRRIAGEEGINWGVPVAIIPDGITTYIDGSVAVGVCYEYKVYRAAVINITTTNRAYGIIYSGIEVAAEENKGKVILLVDDSKSTLVIIDLASSKAGEMGRFFQVTLGTEF